MYRALALGLVLMLGLGCAQPDGISATSHPSWALALDRAEGQGLLDPNCRDTGAVYRVLSDPDAARQNMPSWACGYTLGDIVRIRARCTEYLPLEWLLEHEFLHAILTCSQDGVSYKNENHIGPEWDGLRVGDMLP